MSTQQIPTVAQLAAARKVVWHQETSAESTVTAEREVASGEPVDDGAGDESSGSAEGRETSTTEPVELQARSAAVVTIEAARGFVERAGLIAFLPHPALGAAPAPSLVEATLARPVSAPTAAESELARSLAGRLVTEGAAVPLNLLGAQGTTGETPDFLVSTAAFPYVFTLRGDKGWKQLPETTGANKVSPLAVNTYALLAEGGPRTAYALTGELGKGITEAAVLRALGELWQLLRVIPVAQAGGKATVWEPVTTRLMRQVKAGANAGQPTALSALISLYLGQALLATEEEIEVFLSTVAPRSRVRDVLHALMAAGELETMAVAGKQHLYLPGELPVFAAGEAAAPEERVRREAGPRLEEEGPRMRRMVKDSRPGVGRARPGGERAKPFGDRARPFGDRPRPFRTERGAGGGGFGADRRPGGRRDGDAARGGAAGGYRSRSGEGGERPEGRAPRFDRPWEEDKKAGRAGGFRGDKDVSRGTREGFAARPGRPESGGAGRVFKGGRPERPSFAASGGERPFPPRPRGPAGEGGGAEERERRPFRRTTGEGPGDFRGGGKRPGGDRGRDDRAGGTDRGSRPAFGGRRREETGEGPGRPPFRRFDAAPREGGRPFRPGARGEGPRRPREGGGQQPGGDRPAGRGLAARPGGDRPAGRGFGARGGEGGGARPFRPAGAGRAGTSGRPGASARAGGGGGEQPFAKRPFAKRPGPGARGEAAGAGPFDKFKGGNKPWGKRPPARKIKPEEEGA